MRILFRVSEPTAAPSVTVTPLGSSSLKVEWEPLESHQARGVITQYQVVYRKASSSYETTHNVPGNRHEYIINST